MVNAEYGLRSRDCQACYQTRFLVKCMYMVCTSGRCFYASNGSKTQASQIGPAED